jgi:hypothetical protein
MHCIYIVNEEPAYIGMLSLSLKLFREHNKNVPLIVYYVQDGKKDTREFDLKKIKSVVGSLDLPLDYDSFCKFCDQLNVEIRVRKPIQKESYSSLHRLVLCEVKEEVVLLIDGDTFIFGNIEDFPSIYADFDFVATPNCYGKLASIPGMDPSFKSFNSGVVLCQNGIFHKWMNSLEGYCDGLYNGSHPYSEWLWSVSPGCLGREEFAASLFVMDNGIKYTYFEDKDVQMGSYDWNAKILHTLTPNWLECYNKIFAKKKVFRPMLRKTK